MSVDTPTTKAELDTLIRMRNRGVKEVREKDTWIKFNSFKELEQAIRVMQIELGAKKPLGTKRVRVGRGY